MGIFKDKVIVNKNYTTSNTTITEKKAPTNESVRLLKEFEEKAESKFIDRIDIKTNLLEYTLLEYAKNLTFNGTKFMYYTIINGKQYSGSITLKIPNVDNTYLIGHYNQSNIPDGTEIGFNASYLDIVLKNNPNCSISFNNELSPVIFDKTNVVMPLKL